MHTRSSSDCGTPFGEQVTLLASHLGLDSFCGVLVVGVVGGVLLATCSRAFRTYFHARQPVLLQPNNVNTNSCL